jgi:tagatose-6-phosphate ketose/aldose isomerase
MPRTLFADVDWLRVLSQAHPKAKELLERSDEEQLKRGYFHTLREICQQPKTWLDTSDQMLGAVASLRHCLDGIASLVLTGSGSSEFAGDCVHSPLQNELGVVAQAIGGGTLLTRGRKAFPPEKPGLMVSLARSGDSPESVGALTTFLEIEPELRHLVVSCNEKGGLAQNFCGDPRVTVLTLDDKTNDRSLVMTSSFTNLVLAARFLGFLDRTSDYRDLCRLLSAVAGGLIETYFETFFRVASLPFRRAVFLGSGSRVSGAREASLKMLEMTAGRVSTMSETYLGFRHGPMSFAHEDALIVCFLSSDPTLRAYESDLLRELDRKQLGMSKLIIGEGIPPEVVRENDVLIECPGLAQVGDDDAVVVDVVAGQLLAFFRCLNEGLHPDSPSEDGVINRVVQSFTLHYPARGSQK